MQLGKAVETRNSRIVDIWLGKKRSLEGLSIFFSFKGKKKKKKETSMLKRNLFGNLVISVKTERERPIV